MSAPEPTPVLNVLHGTRGKELCLTSAIMRFLRNEKGKRKFNYQKSVVLYLSLVFEACPVAA